MHHARFINNFAIFHVRIKTKWGPRFESFLQKKVSDYSPIFLIFSDFSPKISISLKKMVIIKRKHIDTGPL